MSRCRYGSRGQPVCRFTLTPSVGLPERPHGSRHHGKPVPASDEPRLMMAPSNVEQIRTVAVRYLCPRNRRFEGHLRLACRTVMRANDQYHTGDICTLAEATCRHGVEKWTLS